MVSTCQTNFINSKDLETGFDLLLRRGVFSSCMRMHVWVKGFCRCGHTFSKTTAERLIVCFPHLGSVSILTFRAAKETPCEVWNILFSNLLFSSWVFLVPPFLTPLFLR